MNTLQRIEHLNRKARELCDQAEKLEAIEEATRYVRPPKNLQAKPWPGTWTVVDRHIWAKTLARALRSQAQDLLIEATNLTDYSFDSDLKAEGWYRHLDALAREAEGLSLSPRQVKSHLDASYHAKAA